MPHKGVRGHEEHDRAAEEQIAVAAEQRRAHDDVGDQQQEVEELRRVEPPRKREPREGDGMPRHEAGHDRPARVAGRRLHFISSA